MTTSTILALSALAVVLAATAVLLCSAHIPGLRVITGAAPLQAEEPIRPLLPLDDNPEGFATGDLAAAAAQVARRATRASDMPHQANRGRSL